MDIEKLIEQLNGYFEGKTLTRGAALDAATALSTLQAENEKLRYELQKIKRDKNALLESYLKNGEEMQSLAIELERVKAERDAAVESIPHECKTCVFGDAWEVTAAELHSMRAKNEWLYRCGHKGTDDYCALWHFEAFPSKEAALRREQDG